MTIDQRVLTEEQEQRVVRLYLDGASVADIAFVFFVSKAAIYRLLRRRNIQRGQTAYKHMKWKAMSKDWNKGMPTEYMVKKYGYASRRSLYIAVCNARKKGYEFKLRETACQKAARRKAEREVE